MAPNRFSATSSAVHMIMRQLFSRLVFSLQFEPLLCMEIISFWLWLEAIGHADFLASVDALNNYRLQSIALAAKTFVEALRLKSKQSTHHGSSQSTHHGSANQGSYFQKQAVEGIVFYLNNVCCKVLGDMLEVAEAKEQIDRARAYQAQQQNMRGKAPMSTKDLLARIKASYTSSRIYEEGSSSRSMIQSPKTTQTLILKDIESPIEQCLSTHSLATLFDALNIKEEKPPTAAIQIQHPRVPRDERTLFVTFSNGYPFTADELYDFFIRNFGDVEVISVQEPVEPRPPLYAHITFFTQETLFRILGGVQTVKFVIRGKHLWARKFVPKQKKFKKN